MSTVISMREVRARIVVDLLKCHPRATAGDIAALLSGLGWTWSATRLAIGDAVLDGRVEPDDTGRLVATT